MLLLLLTMLTILTVGLLVCGGVALGGWRIQHRRACLLAERLRTEAQIEQLTADTLLAMRQVVRQHLRGQR